MSTRSIIARAVGDGWNGRYHHSDGYPHGVGRALWELARGHFADNLPAMMAVLIDDHPAGWSSIIGCDLTQPADFRLAPGFSSDYSHFDTGITPQPRCYCHGARSESHDDMRTHEQGPGAYEEYLYVIHESSGVMTIFDTGNGQPRLLATVDLNDSRLPGILDCEVIGGFVDTANGVWLDDAIALAAAI